MMNSSIKIVKPPFLSLVQLRFMSSKNDIKYEAEKLNKKLVLPKNKPHSVRLKEFFRSKPHIQEIKSDIPKKHLKLKRIKPDNLYLIDRLVAKKAVDHILPNIRKQDQVICENDAGFGFIAQELLNNNIKLVRLYEPCPDWREYLKIKFQNHSDQLEMLTKNIFLMGTYEHMDKQDNGTRVQTLFGGVPKRSWEKDPVMTIIGAITDQRFIRFLLKSKVYDSYVNSLGRIQLFVFMEPKDYITLTAGPHLNLHTYQQISVLFNLFFDSELLDKFPRSAFVPWQSLESKQTKRYAAQIDFDKLYLVKINFKKNLPVDDENLLPFYTFVNQFFGRGGNKIIPILERWVPGCGLDLMLPKLKHEKYFNSIDIFTKFGELTPEEILSVYWEFANNSAFNKSIFLNMIESHLAKTETVDTSLNEHLLKNVEIAEPNENQINDV